MTENPFSLSNLAPTWVGATEILKGDTPGHPFRGNQYQEALSATSKALGRADTAVDMAANSHVETDRHGRPDPEMHQVTAENHREIAELHRTAANALGRGVGEGRTPNEATQKAIDANKLAADAHDRVASIHARIANGNSAEDSSETRSALRESANALSKTEMAHYRTSALAN